VRHIAFLIVGWRSKGLQHLKQYIDKHHYIMTWLISSGCLPHETHPRYTDRIMKRYRDDRLEAAVRSGCDYLAASPLIAKLSTRCEPRISAGPLLAQNWVFPADRVGAVELIGGLPPDREKLSESAARLFRRLG
jgi:hypothetical protein